MNISEKMFKSRQKTTKSAQLKESEPSTITGNKLSILAKLDNMLPGRHSKPSSESGSTSSLVSESEFAKDQKTRNRIMQSPKILYRAIARTLSTKNQPQNNKPTTNMELETNEHLFETNRIEDIQASSILRSLMESYSNEHLAQLKADAGLKTPDYLSQRRRRDLEGGEETEDVKSMGSCTNYFEFDENENNENNENNQTFVVNNDQDEIESKGDGPSSVAMSSVFDRVNEQWSQPFHSSHFKKRKVNYEIKTSFNSNNNNNNDSFVSEGNHQEMNSKSYLDEQPIFENSFSEEDLHFRMLQRLYKSDLIDIVIKYENYRSKLNQILAKSDQNSS